MKQPLFDPTPLRQQLEMCAHALYPPTELSPLPKALHTVFQTIDHIRHLLDLRRWDYVDHPREELQTLDAALALLQHQIDALDMPPVDETIDIVTHRHGISLYQKTRSQP